jgi:hypothetical protein
MDHEYSKLHPRPTAVPVMATTLVQREPKMDDLDESLLGVGDEARAQIARLITLGTNYDAG